MQAPPHVRRRGFRPLLLAVASLTALVMGLAPVPVSGAPIPGGLFVTGHDPDFHALAPSNTTGARNIIQAAVRYVTYENPSPSMLLVTSRILPPAGHRDSLAGIQAAGYAPDVAAAPDQLGVLDLNMVDFNDYDVVVIASDFGGILRQAELDILNVRSADLITYINNGGGIVAFAESNSGAHLTPGGGHFDWAPFLVSELALNQSEIGYTVTPFGASPPLNLTNSDVNGNASHNVFTADGGLNVVNVDASGRIMSLATRGACVGQGGVPSVTIDDVSVAEGAPGDVTTATFTLTLSVTPCGGPMTVDVATADGTATSGSDYSSVAGTISFDPGETVRTVVVPVLGDAMFEPDETFLVQLSNPQNGTISDPEGVGTIVNDDPENRTPDCSSVMADPATLWPPRHDLRSVSLTGATDADGDAVTVAITGVTQDEPTNGLGDGDVSPDAASMTGNSVSLRAERGGLGDGRVYRVGFQGSDGRGGTCSGTVLVGVPHDMRGTAAVDSGAMHDSFAA